MRVRIDAAVDTDLPPGRIREALLDFSPRRLELWADTLDPATYRVHAIGETTAEVTEGSRRPYVWSRERYDWSDPELVTWTSLESNFCTPGSRIAMRITPRTGGGSHVEVTWDRSPSSLRGRLILAGASIGGRRLLEWATRRALTSIRGTLSPA